jgi:diguanylate cyclase (GGDEF)-like protein
MLCVDRNPSLYGLSDRSTPPTSVVRRWAAWVNALIGRGLGDSGNALSDRQRLLLAYTAGSIGLGLLLLAWTTVAIPLGGLINPGLEGTALEGPQGGLLLWLLFGLMGSLRVLRAPGSGSALTFHLPFIAAAMVLGGPTAGAWVAFLSTIERRELESQPWYGILANHAVMATAAVAGGATASVILALMTEAGASGTAGFVAAICGTLVLTILTTAMGAITIMIRDELSPGALIELLSGQVGRLTALEVALAWILVVGYLQLGWWSPILIGGFVLLVWDNDPPPPIDQLTGLEAAAGYRRRLDGGLGLMRRGIVPGGTLMSLDLDGFHDINNQHGHDVGDEVLREIGSRLRAQARRPGDVAGRLGGDELGLFLLGLLDVEVAMQRAADVFAAITGPIATSVGTLSVGVSVGVSVISGRGDLASVDTQLRHADAAMFHAKFGGGGVHRYDPDEPAPFGVPTSRR